MWAWLVSHFTSSLEPTLQNSTVHLIRDCLVLTWNICWKDGFPLPIFIFQASNSLPPCSSSTQHTLYSFTLEKREEMVADTLDSRDETIPVLFLVVGIENAEIPSRWVARVFLFAFERSIESRCFCLFLELIYSLILAVDSVGYRVILPLAHHHVMVASGKITLYLTDRAVQNQFPRSGFITIFSQCIH